MKSYALAIFILLSLSSVIPAQELKDDLYSVAIKDENNSSIVLYIPACLNSDQCQRRLFGTARGFLGMFNTLYFESRRAESYEAAIRELCLQPLINRSDLSAIKNILRQAGVAGESVDYIAKIMEAGSEAINKKYILGGSLPADFHNKMATLGRRLSKMKKNPAFSEACMALADLRAGLKISDVVAGAFLMNALSNDIAAQRFARLKEQIFKAKQNFGKIDPALESALQSAQINMEAARSRFGAFAVMVNDEIDEITSSSIELGTSLAKISAKLSIPASMWIGAPLLTYETLKGISNQWELAQDAVSTVTLIMFLSQYSDTNDFYLYGKLRYYSLLQSAFSTFASKWKDLLTPGQTNSDLASHYSMQKQEVLNSILNPGDEIIIGLILDSSGSMKQNDPKDIRKNAAQTIIGLLSGQERVFIVDFDDSGQWLNAHEWENWNSGDLLSDIDRVNSSGGTDIGRGLLAMRTAIEDKLPSVFQGGILLLTDGIGDYQNEAEWFRDKGIPIHTISLAGDENTALLNNIAGLTGGTYMKAQTAEDIIARFFQFLNRISSKNTIATFNGLIQQDQSIPYSFYVDPNTKSLFSTVSWQGSKVGLQLTDPSGVVYRSGTMDVLWTEGKRFINAKVENPPAGKWSAELSGLEIPPQGEPVSLSISCDAPLKLRIEESRRENAPVYLQIVSDTTSPSIENLQAKVTVTDPNQNVTDISDIFKDNRIQFIPRSGKGNYQFSFSLSGEYENHSKFQRHMEHTLLVGEMDQLNISVVSNRTSNFIETELGKIIGNRAGIRCYFYRNGKPNLLVARGFVSFVRDRTCLVEIQQFIDGQEVNVGDIVQLDVKDWKGDLPN